MRFLSADLIFPIHIPPILNGIIAIDDEGKICDLLDPEKNEISTAMPIERFEGILCPGFVNAHCHLELSHLKGKFLQKKGLPEFISGMVEKRNGKKEEVSLAMSDADNEMFASGIVAVGDISNTTISSDIKLNSKIFYHTFIEIFDIFPDRAESVFESGFAIQNVFSENGLSTSLVPHSFYTVSNRLMKLIYDRAKKSESIFTIHNQETSSENEMFEKGTGILIEKLQELTKAFIEWQPSGKTSLVTFNDRYCPLIPLQLVHNTFTRMSDLHRVVTNSLKIYWCLCVNANLFIENALPDIPIFTKEKCVLTIGTDSYASNTSLSILNELKTISSIYPDISLTEMLPWATINGALFLNVSSRFGNFEKGKTPGINLISNVDLKLMKLSNDSFLKRLV